MIHAAEADGAPRAVLLAKGFRPFFLGAAAYASLAVPLFLLQLGGHVRAGAYLAPMYWHAHEMVFGFSAAVLAGFLLTAVSNWTARPTASGGSLAMLVGLWIAGRLAMLLPALLPRYAPAMIDVAFLPALLAVCARPIFATKSRRNYGILALLGALCLTNAAIHGAALGLAAAQYQRVGSWVAVDVFVVVLVVMTGRVVPLFTRNALRAAEIHGAPVLERFAVASAALVVLLEALEASAQATGLVSIFSGIMVAARMRSWGTRRTARQPLLWVLHAGSAWIAIGLVLRGAAGFGAIPGGSGLHALTAGALGTLTLGMMTRVTLGHTGRVLAVSAPMACAFGAILAAGLVRVVLPILLPGALAPLVVAGLLWSGEFLSYLAVCAPMLVAARVDGRPG